MALHPEDIKAMIRKTGKTVAEIMAAGGYSNSAGTHCLKRHLPGPRRVIADFLSVNPHKLWPADYEPDGTPKSARRHTGKATRRRGGSIGQKSSGALAA